MSNRQAEKKRLDSLTDILPVSGTRSLVVGKTGSGKSSLAYVLVHERAKVDPVIVLDPKMRWEMPGHAVLWNGDTTQEIQGNYIVYRPDKTDPADDINDICEMIYNIGRSGQNVTVYIDEIFPLLGRDTVNGPRFLKLLYTQGRAYGITIICCVQRPASVPLYVMTESEFAFIFRILNADDRKRLQSLYSEDESETGRFLKLEKYYFLAYSEENGLYDDAYKLPENVIKAACPSWR